MLSASGLGRGRDVLSVLLLGDASKEQVHSISEAEQKAVFMLLRLKFSVSFQSEVTCLLSLQ